jgi:glucosylceramidase
MKKILFVLAAMPIMISCVKRVSYEWVATTPDEVWTKQDVKLITEPEAGTATIDAEVAPDAKDGQTVDGFGACFNELGWTSLGLLEASDREAVLDELFTPGKGANFSICRMPVGANDFSRDWYSYNETDGDFEMKKFSIRNDCETLVPFIKAALKYNPSLKIWASPWSPPTWMKDNRYYACQPTSSFFDQRFANSITKEQIRAEGMDMFIQDEAYFKAYALYFKKFIEAYRMEGIEIFMVMPQNEFNSCQPFPSCTWTVKGLAAFTGKYLGPAMKELGVEVYFGTMERPNPLMADSILDDPECRKYIRGAGFQWAGKKAIGEVHRSHPELKLYQTEQECGNGRNSWEGCVHSWGLMKHYFNNGVNVYNYWNLSLEEGGMSRWGWRQNSLVTVDTLTRKYKFTYEYYLLKHVSHYVLAGASYLPVVGDFKDMLAFRNLTGDIVLIIGNGDKQETKRVVKYGDKLLSLTLKPQSINTLKITPGR